MTEAMKIILISSGFTLLGGFVGYIASTIQASITHNRQEKIEGRKRSWHLEDIQRERKLSVLFRRIDKVEEFIGYVNDDFHNLRHDTLYIMNNVDPTEIEARLLGYLNWRDSIPRRIYSYGASVHSLMSDELVNNWKELYETFEKMKEYYLEILRKKQEDPHAFSGQDEGSGTADVLYKEFNQGLGSFIAELDKIRTGNSITISREGT